MDTLDLGTTQHALAGCEPSLLTAVLDALNDHIALLDRNGQILAVNLAWARFAEANGYDGVCAGVGADYLLVCDAAVGTDASGARAAALGIRGVLSGERPHFALVYSCSSPTEDRWFRMEVMRVLQPGPVAAIITHTERTAEQRATNAERAAKATSREHMLRLEATLDALPVGVWLTDATGRVTHTNPAASRLWGGGAPRSQSMEDFGAYRARWPNTGIALGPMDWASARALKTGAMVVDELLEISRFDGTIGHVLVSSAPIRDGDGLVSGAVVVHTDVTDRHAEVQDRDRMVAARELERAQLAAIFEEAPAFLAVLRGPDYVFERINPAYLQLVGHRDPIGKPLLEALPEIRGQGFIELLDSVRLTGVPFIGRQTPVLLARAPGQLLERRYVDMVYLRLPEGDGEVAVVAHGVDVTDQVVATAALIRTEHLLREQFAKLPVPTYLWEHEENDFVLLESNEAAVRAAPAHAEAAVGKRSRELFPTMDAVRHEMTRALRENVVVRCTADFDGGRRFGTRRVDLTIGPQRPNRVLVHAVDTTERIELESQLRQAQKMDAVGRLAGGVAHDFNNLLTVIGAHSGFLLATLDSDDPRHEDAEAIHSAGIRAAGLTRQLLAFSRKQILKPTVLSLNVVVVEMQKMLERLLGEDIEIVLNLAPRLASVTADASQIDQVIVNLSVNARDAMPDGGVLTIATRNVTISPSPREGRQRRPAGDYVLLEVTDTGIGMSAAVQSRLFEPFFTTKGPGMGTGLGLATVYGIVNQSAGYVLVESVPARGTTFQVYLPAVTRELESEDPIVVENGSARGHESILLVEDEPAVRHIADRILKRQGYVVLQAACGAEALALSAAYDGPIHLVISDAVMPGMSGAEVVRRLQAQRPGLKALFMSGYTDDEILRRGIVSSTAAFIQKPFTIAAFSRATREALDG